MVDWWYYNNLFGVEDGLFYENNKRLGYYQDEKEDEILKNNHKATVDRMLELRELNIEFKRINNKLKKENKELKKQLRREETDKKRLMSYLMRYKGFGFDEIVEDFFNEPSYDTWWEDGFYECCWDEYLKEKGSDGM